jgi:uncharacterized protein
MTNLLPGNHSRVKQSGVSIHLILQDNFIMFQDINRGQFLKFSALVEGCLVILALSLGWWVELDPLQSFSLDAADFALGIIAAMPLFLLLLISDKIPSPSMQRIRQFLVETIGASLNSCRWYELIFLAAVVGFSEELLFRGLIQPWIERHAGYTAGLLWSNLIFGLAHCVTLLYGLLAGVMGGYLGWLLDARESRNLLIPMTTHAFYDYLAFLWIARIYRAQQNPNLEPEMNS